MCDFESLIRLQRGQVPIGAEIGSVNEPMIEYLPFMGDIYYNELDSAPDGIYWVVASGAGLVAKVNGNYYHNICW